MHQSCDSECHRGTAAVLPRPHRADPPRVLRMDRGKHDYLPVEVPVLRRRRHRTGDSRGAPAGGTGSRAPTQNPCGLNSSGQPTRSDMSESIGNTGTGMKLHTKILLGLAVGIVLGVITNLTVGPDHPRIQQINTYVTRPIGQIFLRMLFMVVMPLVFASIALGVAGLGDIRKVGRVGGKAIGYFFGTTALAATLGLIVVNAMQPWERVTPETRVELMERFKGDASTKVDASESTGQFGPDTFINIVPRNPVDAAAKTDMLAIIFFGLMFAAGLALIA